MFKEQVDLTWRGIGRGIRRFDRQSKINDEDTSGHTHSGPLPLGVYTLGDKRPGTGGVWGERGGTGLPQWKGRALTELARRGHLLSLSLPPKARGEHGGHSRALTPCTPAQLWSRRPQGGRWGFLPKRRCLESLSAVPPLKQLEHTQL